MKAVDDFNNQNQPTIQFFGVFYFASFSLKIPVEVPLYATKFQAFRMKLRVRDHE